ncbi:suppressor of cytokine signaling 7-like isoform X1 [Alosa alosa]|uniref:suppressor of cytokine signaling 7-like isoform X1 n=1 Tax=Alosa alosa TaxID=278164 RepID=UPI00201511FF|nr:suppressor of cytokine signaling 7-like isoform X1 [Alosa alosa]
MNNAQDMSPDFVLMRLVSAAEYDRVDEENLLTGSGVVSGFGKAALGHHGNNITSGFELDPTNPSAGPVCQTNPSPHCSSQPESGTAALDSGIMLTRPSLSDTQPPPDFAVAQRFEFPHTGGRGSRAQLMVFQNLLTTGEALEQSGYQTGENDTLDGGGTGVSNGGVDDNSNYSISAHQRIPSQRLQWHPVMQLTKVAVEGSDFSMGRGGLCHRHHLVTDTMDWPPLLDKSLQFGMLDPRKAGTDHHREDPVLSLARRLGELGQASEKLLKDGEPLRCSCQSVLASATAGMGPGEDPSETSDALLVLEGLGSSEVGELAMGGCPRPGRDGFKGEPGAQSGEPDTGQDGATTPMTMTTMTVAAATATFSSSSLSGLMQQVQRLAAAGAALGVDAYRDPQTCRPSLPDGLSPSGPLAPDASGSSSATLPEAPAAATTQALEHPQPSDAASPPTPTTAAHTPLSRPPTPKRIGSPMAVAAALGSATLGGGGGASESQKSRGKSRKGSLKIRLSKLFRTRSSGTGVGGAGAGASGGSGGPSPLLDKRPSLASSTSSGGSLMDVWSSSSAEPDAGSRPQLSRPQSAFSPVPFTPAFTGETVSLVDVDISRRGGSSLHPPTPPPPPRRSLSLLDDFGGPQPGVSLDNVVGASMQSLPLRAPPPSHAIIQHSLSLNDTFLRGLPRPIPLVPEGPNSARHEQRPSLFPLSRPDASSFATSLRELEKCGWYWGPMNWEDAELKLKGKPDGSFLVRDSSDPRYILSLSFRSQGVTHHTRMEHYRGTFSLWCHPKFEDRCHSVVEFIERAIMHSKNGKFLYFLRSRVPGLPPTPVQLLYPVSRFSSVKSLQHLCRFCIRQMVRIDHIQELPLPTPLIEYLRKFYYYDPEEEMYMSIREARRDPAAAQPTETQT